MMSIQDRGNAFVDFPQEEEEVNKDEQNPLLSNDGGKLYIEHEGVDDDDEDEMGMGIEEKPEPILVKRVEERPNSASFDILFVKRFGKIVFTKIGLYSCTQIVILFFVVAFSVLGGLTSYWTTLSYSKGLIALQEQKFSNVWKLVLNITIFSLLRLLSDVMISNGFLTTTLSVLWRKNLTKNLLNKYYRKKNYYVILNLQDNAIDNPDQRIQSDAKDFCNNLSQVVVGGCKALGQIGVNLYVIIKYEGYWMLIPVVLLPIISSSIYFLLFFPTSKVVFRRDSQEGDFRFSHARIREHAESMAFFKSGETERKNVNFLFKRLLRTLCCLSCWMFLVNLWTQIGYWTPNVVFLGVIIILVFTNTVPYSKGMKTKEVMDVTTNVFQASQNFAQNVSLFLGLAQNLSVVIGNTARIGEMFESMIQIEKDEKNQRKIGKVLDHPEAIHFEGVNIQTPKGKTLIDNLEMKVTVGDHVIIMGPSGSGKSSILRVLCELWPFSQGVVARPRKIGKKGLFFLPQKPYMVSGSLKENIIYPKSSDEVNCSDEQLIEVMQYAKIDYLLKRASLHEQNVFWEEKLSLGEQQRLQLARLFFHKPRFAALDECTSALDPENEDILYSQIASFGITMLSVAHRRSVMKYHDWILRVHTSDNGYTLEKIDPGQLPNYEFDWEALSSHTVGPDERDDFELTREDIEWRDGNLGKTGLNFTFFKRLFKLCCCCVMIQQWYQCVFIIFTFLFAILFSLSPLIIILLSAQIMGSVIDRNLGMTVILGILIGFGFILVAIGTGSTGFFFMIQGICCRANITKHVQGKYFRNQMFYEVNVLDKKIDNPDQRICSDVDMLTSGFQVKPGISYMESLFLNSIIMVVVMFIISLTVSWLIPIYVLIMYAFSGSVQLVFMIGLSKLRFLQQKREGFLRNSLTRMKEYSEQIAFFNGKRREEKVVREKLKYALRNQWFLGLVTAASGAFVQFLNNIGTAFCFMIIMASIYVKALNLDHMSKGEVVTVVTNNAQFMTNLIFLFLGTLNSMTWIGQIIGNVGRVSELLENMELLNLRRIREEEETKFADRRVTTTDYIGVEDVTGHTPTHKKLFYNLTFRMGKAQSCLIRGPSGCGKSSLLRIVGGLWRQPNGKVFAPSHVGRDGLFFLPQKPYLILGTLKENVIYPDSVTETPDEELLEILRAVNLGYIYDRVGGWESTLEWSTILSPGEQQRIGMARLLYHRPAFAILDECTSALDETNERLMYQTCHDHNISALSVGHRKSIIVHHSHLLEFDGSGGWKFLERRLRRGGVIEVQEEHDLVTEEEEVSIHETNSTDRLEESYLSVSMDNIDEVVDTEYDGVEDEVDEDDDDEMYVDGVGNSIKIENKKDEEDDDEYQY